METPPQQLFGSRGTNNLNKNFLDLIDLSPLEHCQKLYSLDLGTVLEDTFDLEERYWEVKWKEWYYDNLDDIDRKKIRQAMDQ